MNTNKIVAVTAGGLLFASAARAQSGLSSGGNDGGSVNRDMAPAPPGSGSATGGASGTTRLRFDYFI